MAAVVGVQVPGKEFRALPGGKLETVPPLSRKTIYVPIEPGAPWKEAKVVLQAEVADRIVETPAGIRSKRLVECPRSARAAIADGKIDEAEWADAARIEIGSADQVVYGGDRFSRPSMGHQTSPPLAAGVKWLERWPGAIREGDYSLHLTVN